MSPQENIKEELNLLESTLPLPAREPGYTVPAGYFEGLANAVLNRIYLQDELEQISPLLNSISREMPYSTPPDYFDSFRVPLNNDDISDQLAELRNKSTYQLSVNYFDTLPEQILQKIKTIQPAKVVSIGKRNWLRYAAAALITGIALTAGLLIYNSQKHVGPFAGISKEEINSLINLTKVDTTTALIQTTAAEDVKSLVKDISDKEIQDFLKDTDLEDSGTEDDFILN